MGTGLRAFHQKIVKKLCLDPEEKGTGGGLANFKPLWAVRLMKKFLAIADVDMVQVEKEAVDEFVASSVPRRRRADLRKCLSFCDKSIPPLVVDPNKKSE